MQKYKRNFRNHFSRLEPVGKNLRHLLNQRSCLMDSDLEIKFNNKRTCHPQDLCFVAKFGTCPGLSNYENRKRCLAAEIVNTALEGYT